MRPWRHQQGSVLNARCYQGSRMQCLQVAFYLCEDLAKGGLLQSFSSSKNPQINANNSRLVKYWYTHKKQPAAVKNSKSKRFLNMGRQWLNTK